MVKKRLQTIKQIEKRDIKRVNAQLHHGEEQIQENYWEIFVMNAFLHNVYKKYKYAEYMSKRKVKFGQRFAFLCRLIGRCKTIAYNARLRVSGRKVIKFAKHYISQFRERKRLKI